MDSLYYRRSIVEGSLTSRKNIPLYASVTSSREMKTNCRYSIHFTRYIYQSPQRAPFSVTRDAYPLIFLVSLSHAFYYFYDRCNNLYYRHAYYPTTIFFCVACFLYSKPSRVYVYIRTYDQKLRDRLASLTSRLLPKGLNLYGLKPEGEAKRASKRTDKKRNKAS